MPPSVFISYRHADTFAEALLIFSAFRERLGDDAAVFFDTSSIESGAKWPESIRSAIQAAEIVLVVIGPGWLTATDTYARRRIDSEDDWVRHEVATALREKETVIPVLIRDGEIPPAEALPENLRTLADRQAVPLHQASFESALASFAEKICGPRKIKSPPSKTPPHEVPAPVSTFVGRDAEIDRLVEHLSKPDAANAVAICGVRGLGGVGKSQLAFAVARRLVDRFPDGQICVELGGMSGAPLSPDAALRIVLRALGAEPAATDDLARLEAAYRSATHDKRVLVVADDALDKAQVAPLTPSPGSSLIITSRSRLFFAGMRIVDLGPLPPEEAEALLVQICPRIGEAAPRIATLCGHLPLALEISASLLESDPTLGVDEFESRLGDERSKLTALKSLDDPNLDVEAALALSVDRLGPNTRSALAQASIFPASFTREAAEAIIRIDTNEAGATIAALRDLYSRSLVEYDDDTKRYSLHDLTRAFASSHLPDDERYGAQARAVWYFVTVLGEADDLYDEGGESAREGLHRFDAERVHIEAGQRHAAERYRAGDTAFADDCLSFAVRGPSILSLRLHPREYAAWLEVAVKVARTLKDRRDEGIALGNLGNAYADLGDTRKAIEYYEQGLAIAHEVGNRRGEGIALGNLGSAYTDLGNAHKAIEYYEQHLAIAREIGDRRGEGNALGNLGSANVALGDAHKAIKYYEHQRAIAQEIGDRRGEGNALGNLGIAYKNLGDTDKAIEYFEQDLEIAREVGDRRGEGITSFNLGLSLRDLGRTEEAIGFARDAVELYEQTEHPSVHKARRLLADLLEKEWDT